MKNFKRLLALALVLCMVLGVMPLSTFAAETSKATTTENSEDYRILHLDCGRKYFTKDWIIALINEMAAAGYTHLELAFGNDGLRFLLDDMSVGSYTDDQVTAAIQQGNKNYYDFGTNELTEAEMDAIIAHAGSKGIEIIPLFNNPGHMNTVVSAATTLTGSSAGYNGSGSTVDLENEAAVGFVKGLVEKYIAYFDGKGCKEFNFGADEYANDVYPYGSMGFGALVSAGKYQLYVAYVNEVAALIKSYGMTPIAFNDGIYFNQNTSYNFDKDITVAFWTSGWSGYQSASASTMETLGHEMINVNGDYYYVLGKSDQWDSNGYTYAANWSNTTFMGSTVSDPAGSMFCIWCDYPNAETETQIAANTRMILRAMAAEMQGNDANSVSDEVVSGGFNADGTIAEDFSKVTVKDETTTIEVTGTDLTSVTATPVTAPVIEDAAKVLAWDITPYVGTDKYTGKGTVKLPVPEDWNTAMLTGFYMDDGEVVLVKGTYADGYYTFDMPHFSEGGLIELEYNHLVELTVGGNKTITINGIDLTGNTYTPNPTGIASVTTETFKIEGNKTLVEVGSISDIVSGGKYLITTWTNKVLTANNGSYNGNNNLLALDEGTVGVNNSNVWTITSSGAGYTISSGDDNYLTFDTNTASVTGTATNITIGITDYGFTLQANGDYLNNFGGADQAAGGWYELDNNCYWYLYRIDGEETTGGTKVTFTGETAGETYVTINNEVYKIVVHGTKDITIHYQTADGTVVKTETVTVADNATTYTVSNFNHNGKFYTVAETTLTIDPKNETSYTVTVTEVEEDLSQVANLVIEYWQTNSPVNAPETNGAGSMSVSATDAYSEAGLSLIGRIPATGYREGNPVVYWRSRLLADGERQESGSGSEDRTWSGTGFTKVRYWNGSWAVYTDAGEWKNFDPDNYQLVAYYMNDMDLAEEVKVGTADWAEKGNVAPGYAEEGFVSIVFQVIYEGTTSFPADVTTADVGEYSYIVNAWRNSSNEVQRGVGTLSLTQIDDYAIWKVTATTGTHKLSSNNTISSIEWLNNERVLFVDEENPVSQYTIHNPSQPQNVLMDDEHENLYWDAENESILIRIYVKAEETEDSLKVVYYDEKFGATLHEFNILVPTGSNFNNGIVVKDTTTPAILPAFGNSTTRKNATGYGIVNTLQKTQNFETTLANVAVTNNRYNKDLYEYTGSIVSEDGKTITHYYSINQSALSPNFVADFGLPIKFELSDVVKSGIDTVQSVTVNANTRYGTLAYNADDQTFTYTPTTVLQGIDVLTINIGFAGTGDTITTVTTNVGVTPATTVYYEEGFLENWSGTWTDKGTKHSFANQTAQILGSSTDNYGYDSNIISNGSDATTSTIGASATFTFTGTGFDLYANCDGNTGYVLVEVRDSANVLKRVFMVNTKVATAENATDATSGQTGAFKSLPVVTLEGLTHGTYTVTVKKITDEKAINIDGFRIYGTIKEDITTNEDGTVTNNSIYKSDLEDNPEFHEIRDNVLNGVDIKNSMYNYKKICSNANGYYDISGLAQYIHGQVYTADSTLAGALVMSGENAAYDAAALKDLLDNGPKNELFLYEGQSVTFSVTTNRVMQIGLKAPQGATKYSISYKVGDQTTAVATDKDISTSVDMFYDVVGQADSETTYTVTITNADTGILSVTDLKICDDPNATFNALTAADIEAALNAMGYADAEPENPETPAAPEDSDDSKTPEDPKATCAEHKGGTATCKDKAVCTVCGEAYGELDAENHTGEAKWSHTDGKHSKAYDCCGKVVVAEEAHKLTDGKCECGYEAPASDDNSQTSDNNQTSDNSQTGDNSHVVLFGSLLVISALAAIVLLVPDVRKKLIK